MLEHAAGERQTPLSAEDNLFGNERKGSDGGLKPTPQECHLHNPAGLEDARIRRLAVSSSNYSRLTLLDAGNLLIRRKVQQRPQCMNAESVALDRVA